MMNIVKKIGCVAIALGCVLCNPIYANTNKNISTVNEYVYDTIPISLYINGEYTETKITPPIQIEGNTLVPAREVFEKMGANVVWSSNEKKVYIDKEDVFIVLELDNPEIIINGVPKLSTVPAISINQKIMIPLRFISQEIGYKVEWIGKTKTITIDETKPPVVLPEEDKDSQKPGEDNTEEDKDSQEPGEDNTEEDKDSQEPEEDNTEEDKDSQKPGEDNTEEDSSGDKDVPEVDEDKDKDELPDQDSNAEVELKNMTYYPEENTINLVKPEGMNKEKIVVDEKYIDRKIVITLDDNYSDFYESGTWALLDDYVQKIEIKHDGVTKIILTTSKVYAMNIQEIEGSLLLECVEPREKYEKIVIIDPGHGAHDPGAMYQNLKEKDFVIDVGLRLRGLLKNNNDIKVYMTREGDTFLSPYERADLANEIDSDLFISIHVNSASASAKGIETYYTSKPDTRNKIFASMVQKKLIETFPTRDRGVKQNVFIVTKNTKSPSILIEMGFLSNQEDRAMMLAEGASDKYAKVIYDCILSYYDQGLNK